MLKNVVTLGKTLDKVEQKTVNGGNTGCSNNPRGMCPTGLTFNTETCTCVPFGF